MSTQIAEKKTDNTLRSHIESAGFAEQIAKVLPAHLTPQRMVRVAVTAMLKNADLMKCTQTSFFNSMLTCSQFGIEPDGRLAHLIPFANRKQGTTECQLIIDYKGLVALAHRSGRVSNIHADKVCVEDIFEYDKGQIIAHKIDFRKPRGEAFAYYCIVKMKDGSEKCEVMQVSEVQAIRSRSRSASHGPWVTDFDEMAKKTVFRRVSKWIELSPEFRDALDHDDQDYVVDGRVKQRSVQSGSSVVAMLENFVEPAAEGLGEEAETLRPATRKSKPAADQGKIMAAYRGVIGKTTATSDLEKLASDIETDDLLSEHSRDELLVDVNELIEVSRSS